MANHLKRHIKSTPARLADWLKYFAWLCLLVTASTPACELPAWQASYNITKYGASVAQVEMSLQTTGNTAQYRLHTKAVGILAVISKEELTETSQLKQAADKSWQLIQFSQLRAKDPHRYQQFTLQQSDDQVIATGEHDDKSFSLPVQRPVWDRSSVQLALTCDLLADANPRPAYDYSIIDDGNLATYHFEYRGQENIRIADKKFATLKFERISGDRSTQFWLAPTLNYMPVRIEQYKKGSIHLRMNLDIPVTELP